MRPETVKMEGKKKKKQGRKFNFIDRNLLKM